MRQFDVYENPSPQARRFAPCLVVLSSDLMELSAVMIAPMLNDRERRLGTVDVSVTFAGDALTLAFLEMAAVSPRHLRRRLGSVLDQEYEIRRGIDRLFTGF